MIVSNFHAFRSLFAVHAAYASSGGDPLQFVAPNIIRRTGGQSWVTSGFEVGMRVQPQNTTSNNNYFHIDSFQASNSEIITAENYVINEGPLTGGEIVGGVHIENGGIERWPVNLVRANGFDGGISGYTIPYAGLFMTLTVNGGAADASPGVDEYDWYLSQRTDDPARQHLLFAQAPDSVGDTFSGSVLLQHSQVAADELGIPPAQPCTPSQIIALFKYMHLYVRRRSDGAIQWNDLLRVQVAAA